MRWSILIFFTILLVEALPQNPDSLFYFSGYILDEDSLPIEDAMLVNYRTARGYLTKQNGYFRIRVAEGDSLMINHVSSERRIVKANRSPTSLNRYYLKMDIYKIPSVSVKFHDKEMENFRRNMAQITIEMRKNAPNYNTHPDINTYAPPSRNQTFGVNLFDLLNYIKNKKYRNGGNN